MYLFSILLSALLSIASIEVSDPKPFTIVELFTSEGCSSCPPADRLLSEIVSNSNSDIEVMALSFHVDYWDYIGWKDPYARKEFSNRQRTYASKLKSYQVYTPQMIVNGRHEFVGSNRREWQNAFETESKRKPEHELALSNVRVKNGALHFDIGHDLPQSSFINVAVVERELSQNVARGENRGRKLEHDNVVRHFLTSRNLDKTAFDISIDDVDLTKASLVVYAQLEENYDIIAASQHTF